ncbi:nucleoside phosphorylase domain-containing protein, partial [Microdochium trichocladiopsis]
MAASQGDPAAILDPKDYAIVWIAPLEIEAKAALCMLDEQHQGRFAVDHGDEYVFHAGSMCGHNVVIATFPAGQEYGTGPVLQSTRDIRLGDVLVSLPEGERAGIIAYDLGKETDDGFQPLRYGHVLTTTKPIVRSAIGRIKIEAPNDAAIFLPYYETIRDREHATGTFTDPGQDHDRLYSTTTEGKPGAAIERARRPDIARTRVWYGPIGSGDKLLKNAQKRNELRDKHGVIGLEMEAAGTMNRIPVGVIRGVCDYGDQQKNKEWQPYAAAMAAASNGGIGKTQIALRFAYDIKASRPDYSIFWVPVLSYGSVEQAYVEMARKLGVQKKTDDEDIKELELFFGSEDKAGIEEYLPKSENGLILLTTRSREVAVQFAQTNTVDIEAMDSKEATLLFKKSLTQGQTPQDEALLEDLLIQLTYLPLAITQAAAYLNQTK